MYSNSQDEVSMLGEQFSGLKRSPTDVEEEHQVGFGLCILKKASSVIRLKIR